MYPLRRYTGLFYIGNWLQRGQIGVEVGDGLMRRNNFQARCARPGVAFSSGKPKPIRSKNFEGSCICVTKGIEPPSRMKTVSCQSLFPRRPGLSGKSVRVRSDPRFSGTQDFKFAMNRFGSSFRTCFSTSLAICVAPDRNETCGEFGKCF